MNESMESFKIDMRTEIPCDGEDLLGTSIECRDMDRQEKYSMPKTAH